MSKFIELTQGYKTEVDDEWYDYLNQWKWHYNGGYAVRHTKRVQGRQGRILMHRLVCSTPDELSTDHINGNKLDNRQENLRTCNASQNAANKKVARINMSGYKGVHHKRKRGKWEVKIKINGVSTFVGMYNNPIDAARAYDTKAIELFGEFARINGV